MRIPTFTDKERYALDQLESWLQDSDDGSDPDEDCFAGPHFDNEGEIYASHVLEAFQKLMSLLPPNN